MENNKRPSDSLDFPPIQTSDDSQKRRKDVTQEYMENTTAHGPPHVAKAKGPTRRAIWIAVNLILTGVFIFHTFTTVRAYLDFKVNILMKVNNSNQIEFPAITICNQNAYKANESQAFIDQLIRAYMADPSKVKMPFWLRSFVRPGFDPSIIGQEISKLDDVTVLSAMMLETVTVYGPQIGYTMENISHRTEDLLLDCTFNREECNYSSIRHVYNWLYGRCIILNSNRQWISYEPGQRRGLDVLLNIETMTHPGIAESSGVRVLVHGPSEMPIVDENGFDAAPGYTASVALTARKQAHLGGRYGDCFSDEQGEKVSNFYRDHYNWTSYSVKACVSTCIQQVVISKCNCYYEKYPTPKAEDQRNLKCCSDNMTISGYDEGSPCLKKLKESYKEFEHCDQTCRQPCGSVEYTTSLSFSKRATYYQKAQQSRDGVFNDSLGEFTKHFSDSAMARQVIRSNLEDQNFLQVRVYFETFSHQMVSEVPAIQFTECLSDFGGNLGLYMGASLFTVAGFFEYLYDIIKWMCPAKSIRTASK